MPTCNPHYFYDTGMKQWYYYSLGRGWSDDISTHGSV